MNGPARRSRQADAVLAGVTALWGLTFVVVKDAVVRADPLTFLALRFAVGAAVLTVFSGRALVAPRLLRIGAGVGVVLFAGFALQTYGLVLTTPSRSAFITGLSVLLVPFLAIVLYRHRPGVPRLVGVGLAAAGLWTLTGAGTGGGAAGSGELLTFGCAVAFAFHILLVDRYSRQLPAIPFVAVQLWTAAALAGLGRTLAPHRLEPDAGFVWAVLVCGVLASAVAIGLQTWAQARTSAVRAALIFALEPVFASAYSGLLGRERLGTRELSGGALIVTGVLVAELGGIVWTQLRTRGRRAARDG